MDHQDFDNAKGIKSLFELVKDTLSDNQKLFDGGSSHESNPPDSSDQLEIPGLALVRPLGEGSMGKVWLASQYRPDRSVAVKMIHPRILDSNQAKYRFLREIELTGKLNHPGICQIYDAGVSHGYFYYIMEYVEGTTFDQYLDVQQPSHNDKIELVISLCRAIHHAHQRGVIHRDLKPSNLLVDTEGQLHVLDFGIASTIQHDSSDELATLTLDDEMLGTIKYMSPEQASGNYKLVGLESDVYAIGVILYKVFTNRYPFDKGTDFEIREQISKGRIQRPRVISKTISKDLEAIILKALQLNPSGRYHSAAEFADDLQRYLEGNPVNARKVTFPYLFQKSIKRHPMRYGTALIVILGLICLSILTYHSNKLSDELEQQQATNVQLTDFNTEANHDLKITIASKDIEAGRINAAASVLKTIPESQRSLEYHILNRVIDNRVWTKTIPKGYYSRISFDEENKLLRLSSDHSPQVKLPLSDLSTPPSNFTTSAKQYHYYTNGGKYGINRNNKGPQGRVLDIYSTEDDRLLFKIPIPDHTYPQRYHVVENENKIICISESSLVYIDTTTNQFHTILSFEEKKRIRFKLQAELSLIAVVSNNNQSELLIHDLNSNQTHMKIVLPRKDTSLAIHNQLPFIATWHMDHGITIWEVNNYKLKELAYFPSQSVLITNVVFSKNHPSILVTYYNGKTQQLNYLNKTVKSYFGIDTTAWSVIDFENQRYVVVAGFDELACFDTLNHSDYGKPTQHIIRPYDLIKPITHFVESTRDYHAFITHDQQLFNYRVASNSLGKIDLPHEIKTLSCNNRFLFYSTQVQNDYRIYKIELMNTKPEKQPKEIHKFSEPIIGLHAIADTPLLAIKFKSKSVVIFDYAQKTIIHTINSVQQSQPSPDGKYLYVAHQSNSSKSRILKYDTDSWSYRELANTNYKVRYMHLSNSGLYLVTTSPENQLSIHHTENNLLLHHRTVHTDQYLHSLIFSEDDSRLIIGGRNLLFINSSTWLTTLTIPGSPSTMYSPILTDKNNQRLHVLKNGIITHYP